jgi:hypothetical protein
MVSIPKPDPSVGETFAAFPPSVRKKILALRRLIFETADATEGVGPITETLKWGQPSHLIEASRSGTTIRLGWKASAPTQYAMYVHCQTHRWTVFAPCFRATSRSRTTARLFSNWMTPWQKSRCRAVSRWR